MRAMALVVAGAVSLLAACGDNLGTADRDGADQSMVANKVVGRDGFESGSGGAMAGSVGVTGGAPTSVAAEEAARVAASPPAAPGMAPPEPGAALPTSSQAGISSMVIRTGDARVEVDSLEIALARLHALATQLGGYIGNTSMQAGTHEVRQATVEMKLPSERFDAARTGLSSIGRVEYVNVQAQDVSEEYVDVTARVENARRLEQRLVALLATRTGRLEEVLSVERELNRIRETIERYEGRLRYLRTRVAISTLMITVHEEEPLGGKLGSGNRIIEAFRDAWRNFVGFLALFIEALGVLIPLGIIAGVIAWLWRRRPPRAQPPVQPHVEERRPS